MIDDRGAERDSDGGYFDAGIEPSEGMAAIAAAATGGQPAVERYEIAGRERGPAPFAAGS